MNSRDFLSDPIWLTDSKEGVNDYEQSLPILLKMLSILDQHQLIINRTPEICLDNWKLKLRLIDSDKTINLDILINHEEITLHQYGEGVGFLNLQSRFSGYLKSSNSTSQPHYHVVEEFNDDVFQKIWQDIKRLLETW